MDPLTSQLLEKIGPAFSESMSSVFSMLTGKEFTVSYQVGGSLEHDAIGSKVDGTAILVRANYTKGVTGTIFFFLALKEGTMLVDLMLGGEGMPSAELAGDSRDALAETFNQILGSANQSMSDMAGETVSIANVEIFSMNKGEENTLKDLMGAGPFAALELPTVQEPLSTVIYLLFPSALQEQFKRKLGMGGAEEVAAPPQSAPSASAQTQPAAATTAAIPSSPTATINQTQMMSARSMPSVDTANLDLLLDIELPVMVRMGQTEMPLGELLKLTPGAILELNRAADSPVDLLVNGKQIAKGEVVVVDGNFAFRITEIESTDARIRSLG